MKQRKKKTHFELIFQYFFFLVFFLNFKLVFQHTNKLNRKKMSNSKYADTYIPSSGKGVVLPMKSYPVQSSMLSYCSPVVSIIELTLYRDGYGTVVMDNGLYCEISSMALHLISKHKFAPVFRLTSRDACGDWLDNGILEEKMKAVKQVRSFKYFQCILYVLFFS